ncbi:MAG: prephenate dehydrogenase/arogenate dehydrogenase family protein [Acidimicrobiales bacterium]|nr:prephenate dehydrogenase/arogenate dehydrogenase family protein [Acidimicrobiales bacterium]MDG1846164.1 prephenate dehydrogenase/arogenate dehydrogenase family protein [Acidimicrobiales bacterium]
MAGKAGIIGLGLIGGSIGIALREAGWFVVGNDISEEQRLLAKELGAVDEIGTMKDVDIAFVATPVSGVVDAVRQAIDEGASTVTDVGSVKGLIAEKVNSPQFVPGHPMAGSEQEGIKGARGDLFRGAAWVLTPNSATDDNHFAQVRAVIVDLGADVVVIDADSHDELVAVVSHVPHLTAGALMCIADNHSQEHRPLLRLAAGGFRDMTRIAAGHPGIWPDICMDNADAIIGVLDEVIASLKETQKIIQGKNKDALLEKLQQARIARVNLPTGVPHDIDLDIVRIPVLDQPGELASLTRLATEIDVNIYDLEIAHSSEGKRGVVIMVVPSDKSERLVGGLMANGYRPSIRTME